MYLKLVIFFASRRRHARYWRDWSSDVCSSDLSGRARVREGHRHGPRAHERLGLGGGRRWVARRPAADREGGGEGKRVGRGGGRIIKKKKNNKHFMSTILHDPISISLTIRLHPY